MISTSGLFWWGLILVVVVVVEVEDWDEDGRAMREEAGGCGVKKFLPSRMGEREAWYVRWPLEWACSVMVKTVV